MFDFSFPELLLILVVALVVIGPERLPRVARTMGYWLGRARAMFNSVRRDVEREAHLDELRQAGRDFRKDTDLGLNEDVMKDADADAGKKARRDGSPSGSPGAQGSGAGTRRRSIADDEGGDEPTDSAGAGKGKAGQGDHGDT